MGDTRKTLPPSSSDESPKELTAEQRVRAKSRSVQIGAVGGATYVYTQQANKIPNTLAQGNYFYGTTPEEAWNKALLYLITERLKS